MPWSLFFFFFSEGCVCVWGGVFCLIIGLVPCCFEGMRFFVSLVSPHYDK